ncbi:MAG: DUF937 domain-containing protein [Acidobacteria bacterium]|nr:DUF937 domain-containing protein [Acidobacteriota bacterium]
MSSILDILGGQLGGDTIQQLSDTIGADPQATSKAISGALPLLLGALAKNASDPRGAQALAGALNRDHDGSLLDNLSGFLGQGATAPGDGILRHVLGERRGNAEVGLSQMSGLDTASISQLMALLAPMVMGALGKAQRQKGLDAGSLAGLLRHEQTRAQKTAPSGMGGLLSAFLDQDGDGEIGDDVARMGVDLLGKWLKR